MFISTDFNIHQKTINGRQWFTFLVYVEFLFDFSFDLSSKNILRKKWVFHVEISRDTESPYP